MNAGSSSAGRASVSRCSDTARSKPEGVAMPVDGRVSVGPGRGRSGSSDAPSRLGQPGASLGASTTAVAVVVVDATGSTVAVAMSVSRVAVATGCGVGSPVSDRAQTRHVASVSRLGEPQPAQNVTSDPPTSCGRQVRGPRALTRGGRTGAIISGGVYGADAIFSTGVLNRKVLSGRGTRRGEPARLEIGAVEPDGDGAVVDEGDLHVGAEPGRWR
jgi:hypothetical protein